MSIETLFTWLGDSAPGRYLAASTPAFAAVQSVHLLALAALGGAVIVTNLSFLRVIFRGTDPRGVARALFPLFIGSLLVMLLSGTLLVAAGPVKYLLNPLFWPKLGTLAVALAVQLLLHPLAPRIFGRHAPALQYWLSILSLFLWLTVMVIGRWVGLI